MSKDPPLRRIIRVATIESRGVTGGHKWSVPHLRADRRATGDITQGAALACTSVESTEDLAMAMLAEHKRRVEVSARDEAAALEARMASDRSTLERERDVERERHLAEEAKLRSATRRVVSALRASVAELSACRIEATLSVEERVAQLAMVIARRVVGAVVEDRRHDVRALVTGLLTEARRRFPAQRAELHICSADVELLGGADLGASIELVVDEDLRPGEARIRTEDGEVWDGVFSRLDSLSDAILGPNGDDGGKRRNAA